MVCFRRCGVSLILSIKEIPLKVDTVVAKVDCLNLLSTVTDGIKGQI